MEQRLFPSSKTHNSESMLHLCLELSASHPFASVHDNFQANYVNMNNKCEDMYALRDETIFVHVRQAPSFSQHNKLHRFYNAESFIVFTSFHRYQSLIENVDDN